MEGATQILKLQAAGKNARMRTVAESMGLNWKGDGDRVPPKMKRIKETMSNQNDQNEADFLWHLRG